MKLTPERAMEYLMDAVAQLREENNVLRDSLRKQAHVAQNELEELIDLMRAGEGLHRLREGWSYYFSPGNYIRPIKGETWQECLRKLKAFREKETKE